MASPGLLQAALDHIALDGLVADRTERQPEGMRDDKARDGLTRRVISGTWVIETECQLMAVEGALKQPDRLLAHRS